MLEGWCRFGVQELISTSSYKSARITQLDRNEAGAFPFSNPSSAVANQQIKCDEISLLSG